MAPAVGVAGGGVGAGEVVCAVLVEAVELAVSKGIVVDAVGTTEREGVGAFVKIWESDTAAAPRRPTVLGTKRAE